MRKRGGSTVGRGTATFDARNQDEPGHRIEVIENPIVANAPAPAEAVAFEPLDIARIRIVAHSLAGGAAASVRRSFWN